LVDYQSTGGRGHGHEAALTGNLIGSGVALETFAAAPASPTRIDFDQVFADVTRQSAGYVDRARKSDRLPNFKTVLPEPAVLPFCEPLASEFADPILGRIVGRCDA
jgi:hypothetical protein